ncbi:MAG: hypothetical protein ACE5G0_15660 [Rhodothermales bacterium]
MITVWGLSVAACSEEPTVASEDQDEASFAAATESSYETATLTALTATVVAAAANDPGPLASKQAASCPEVSVGAQQDNRSYSITLDAGNGCTLNGKTYRGSLNIAVQLKPLGGAGSTTATATFDEFYADEQKVDGTLSATFSVQDGTASGTASLDLTLAHQDQSVAGEASLNVVIRTQQTLALEDDEARITGTADLDYTNNDDVAAASIAISDEHPVTFVGGCPFPVDGTFEADGSLHGRTFSGVEVDFAPHQGACDTVVAVTVGGLTRTYDFTDIRNNK